MADTAQLDQAARMLRALADRDRLRIIQCLGDGPKNVGAVAECLDLPVVNVSHHFGVLRHAGLVVDEKQGRYVVYRLHPDVFHYADAVCGGRIDLGCCQFELPKV